MELIVLFKAHALFDFSENYGRLNISMLKLSFGSFRENKKKTGRRLRAEKVERAGERS